MQGDMSAKKTSPRLLVQIGLFLMLPRVRKGMQQRYGRSSSRSSLKGRSLIPVAKCDSTELNNKAKVKKFNSIILRAFRFDTDTASNLSAEVL